MNAEEKAKVKKIGRLITLIIFSGLIISNLGVFIYHRMTDAPATSNIKTGAAPVEDQASAKNPKTLFEYADAGNVITLLDKSCNQTGTVKLIAQGFGIETNSIKALSFKNEGGEINTGCYGIVTSSQEVVYAFSEENSLQPPLNLSYFTKISGAYNQERTIAEKNLGNLAAASIIKNEKPDLENPSFWSTERVVEQTEDGLAIRMVFSPDDQCANYSAATARRMASENGVPVISLMAVEMSVKSTKEGMTDFAPAKVGCYIDQPSEKRVSLLLSPHGSYAQVSYDQLKRY